MSDLLLCDDHAVFADALGSALGQRGFTVLATADTLAGAKERAARHRPDVCLLDRFFADGDGLDAVPEIAASTRVLVLTADGDVDGRHRALRTGARGHVTKMCGLSALCAAVEAVARDEVVVETAAARPEAATGDSDAHRLAAYLTDRERQCLGLLVEGHRTTSMADGLGVSPTTVRTHVQSVLTKLGVHSRLEAASLALRHSLLEAPQRSGQGGPARPRGL